MGRSIGTVTINLDAGTSQLVLGLNKGKVAVRDFAAQMGHSSGETLKANAAIRALQGNMQSNTRAVSIFLRETLHLGPALSAAFSVIGPLLFAKVIYDVGTKIHAFFKDLQEAPRLAAIAFRELNAPLALTVAELKVAGDRLDNDIAKLQGRRQNTIKLALDEAAASAEKLADALDKDLALLDKTIEKQKTSWYGELFGAQGSTDPLQKLAQQTRESLAGAKGDPYGQVLILEKALGELRDMTDRATKSNVAYAHASGLTSTEAKDETKNLRALAAATEFYQNSLDVITETTANNKREATKGILESGAANAKLGLPEKIEIDKLKADLKGLDAELAAVGKGDAFKEQAKAALLLAEAIAKINARLEEKYPGAGKTASPATVAEVGGLINKIVADQARIETGGKVDEHIRKLKEEAAAYYDIANAIGLGFTATREAAIQSAVLKAPGYGKPGFDEERVRQEETIKFDAQHAAEINKSVYALRQEGDLALKLAAAQSQGARAVKDAELEEKKRILQDEHGFEGWIEAEQLQRTADAQREDADSAELASINLKIAASNRLAAAKGEQAKREAEIANKQAEAAFKGGGPGAVAGVGAEEAATQRAKLLEEVDKLVQDYANKIAEINRQEDAISKAYIQDVNTIRAIHALEQERLKDLSAYELQQRTLASGVKAFFLDMQQDAESAGEIIYKELHSAFDRLSDEFGKLFTGQIKRKDIGKDFGKTLQGLGGELVTSSLKSIAQKGLGEIGKHIPGLSDLVKSGPLLSKGNPGYVIIVGGAGGITPGVPIPGPGGALGKILGGLAPSSAPAFGGFLAGGGNMSPGMAYIAGEAGPELVTSRSGGLVIPMSHMGGATYMIDARGADLGAANRISRAIEASSRASVEQSARMQHERARRTPQRTT